MPDFPIIDTHLHLWDPANAFRPPWLEAYPPFNRPFLLEDYDRAVGGTAVEAMVFIECNVGARNALAEARWVASLAERDPRIRCIVANAPLELGDGARGALDELAAIPGVKGIRRIIQFEEDPEFCLRPGFVRGVQLLSEYRLSFDICIAHAQLPAAIELVRRCPQTDFVLDHIAKPNIAARLLQPWQRDVRTIAAFPNVVCKVSGLISEADPEKWTPADLTPYLDHVLECFGAERLMFGGDWPIVTGAGTHARWLAALDAYLSGCSEAERRRIFRGTAEGAYRCGVGG